MNLDFNFFSESSDSGKNNFFLREKRNDLFTEDLLYPIKYIGKEIEEKKVKDKIIAGVLKCDKRTGITKDKEFGELAVFQDSSKTESVTYVVSRKPFYNISFEKTNDKTQHFGYDKSSAFICLKNKCLDDSNENTVKLFFRTFLKSTALQQLFSLPTSVSYIDYLQNEVDLTVSDFSILHSFLNEFVEDSKNPPSIPSDSVPKELDYLAIKNLCHRLYVFFRESPKSNSRSEYNKNLLENILTDEDYRFF